MTLLHAKHEPYTDGHLARVAQDMLLAGPPTIRAVRFGPDLFALEGSHRIACAHHFGLIPRIILLEPDTEGCESFWHRLRGTLPIYEFDHLLVLAEADFLS